MHSYHLFLISSASVSYILFFFFPLSSPSLHELFLGISNFHEEISSLFHSIVLFFFFFFFSLTTEEDFLSLLAILWNSAFKWLYLSFSPLPFQSFLFSAIFKASSDNHFAFLHFFFLGIVLITASCTMQQTSICASSGTLSYLIPWICLSLPLYNRKGFDLGHIWKDPDSGKDSRQEEKVTTEDEMIRWHHWLNGDEFV